MVRSPLDVVFKYYRKFYDTDDDFGFLCESNETFMHPVLTPNFFCGTYFGQALLRRNASRFHEQFGQACHWVHILVDDSDATRVLHENGYDRVLSCSFNVFTKPFLRPVRDDLEIVQMTEMSSDLRDSYEALTAANSHNLPAEILRKIEIVLKGGSDQLTWQLVFSAKKRLLGAVTTVRCGDLTLIVNGWVDQAHRGRGIMSSLFSAALQREFAQGQSAAFYWTFNPLIAIKGDMTTRVTIYQKCNEKSLHL